MTARVSKPARKGAGACMRDDGAARVGGSGAASLFLAPLFPQRSLVFQSLLPYCFRAAALLTLRGAC